MVGAVGAGAVNPIAEPGDRLAYLTAGDATITLESARTGARFTYLVQAPRVDGRRDHGADKRFVSLLSGGNVYAYIGFLSRTDRAGELVPWHFVHGRRKAAAGPNAPSVRALAWFLRHPESPEVIVYHSGRCGRCGRELTVPGSILTGLGPVCRGAA